MKRPLFFVVGMERCRKLPFQDLRTLKQFDFQPFKRKKMSLTIKSRKVKNERFRVLYGKLLLSHSCCETLPFITDVWPV